MAVDFPRYARVNTLLTTQTRVLAALEENGYKQVTPAEMKQFLCGSVPRTSTTDGSGTGHPQEQWVCVDDAVVANLLAFPPHTDFHDHPLYLSGHLILQDKVL